MKNFNVSNNNTDEMATSNEEYIKKNKILIVDDDKNTRLHYACALNNLEEVEKQVATGQKLDPENYLGWTPLMMAVKNCNNVIVDYLLNRGGDATRKNKFNMNVFLISVTCGDITIMEKVLNHLLSGGVSRQSMQKLFSPISLSILFGQRHITNYLIERSFDINAAAPLTGITPLMFAAAVGDYNIFKKLLEKKANAKAKNYLGKTANDIFQFRHKKIDIDAVVTKTKPPPLIIVSPHTPNTPFLQLTPYGYPIIGPRKSSNVESPQFIHTPNITPISTVPPQIFFGSAFSPSPVYTTPTGFATNDVFNTALTPSGFFSPLIPQF